MYAGNITTPQGLKAATTPALKAKAIGMSKNNVQILQVD